METPASRRLQRSVRLGAFLMVITSAVALYITERLAVSSLLLLAVVPFGWWFGKKRVNGNFWEITSFLYLIFFFLDLFRISSGLAPALVHLFIFILINKMFNLHLDRDYYQLYLLSFLTVLAASSLYVEIQMFYLIVFYILLLVWNVISVTLLKEWKQSGDSQIAFSFLHPLYILMIVVTVSVTFVIAMGIFFIVPRMQLGYFAGFNPGQAQHVSGFSQKVELGEIANIQDDAGEAMKVKVSSSRPLSTQRFYWRGIAFDHYDGKAWSNSIPGSRFLFQDSAGLFYNQHYTESPDLLVKQEFYMAPLDTRVIFGQDRIVMVEGPFNSVSRDNNGTLEGMARAEKYVVYSRIYTFRPEWLRARTIHSSENFRRYFTQLPRRSDRLEQLAKSITRDASSVYEKAFRVQEYLSKNYTYTTTDLPRDPNDPIASFLFEKKAGHCEYFATSMCLLLRHLGIPSRVVNGFLEGEYNAIGNFYLVRQTDAHSWVEVYFGEGLWVTFDPSPRLLTDTAAGSSLWGWIVTNVRKMRESISFFWDRYILIFSAQDQLNALSTVREQYEALREKAAQSTDRNLSDWKTALRSYRGRKGILSFVAVLLVAAAFVIVYRLVAHRRKMQISKTPVLFYQEMLSILNRKGYVRSPVVTPAEFLESVRESLPPAYVGDLSSLTDLFYRARFGNHVVTPEEQALVRSALVRLEQMK